MRHMGGNYVRRLLVTLKVVKMTIVMSGSSDRGRDCAPTRWKDI